MDFYTYRGDIRAALGGSPIAYDYDTTTSPGLEQGEQVAYNATTKKVVRFVRDGGQGKFVGITRDSHATLLKLGNQPALVKALVQQFSVFSTGIHELVGSVGDTYVHGDVVYMADTDTTKVTKTQGTGGIAIGTAHLPDGSSKVGAVRVPILVDEYTKTQV